MVTPLVTLQEARLHLRSDTVEDDIDLNTKILAASEAVRTYLKIGADESIPANAQYAAKASTLLLLGELYKNREGESEGVIGSEHGYGYLPRSVMSLLYPHRMPSAA